MSYNSVRDELVACIAEVMRYGLKDLFGVTILAPKELKVGDVAQTNGLTQFHADGAINRSDPRLGVIHLDLHFYREGTLMLVLEFLENDRAYVLDLMNGKTGWVKRDCLEHHHA